MRWLLLLCAVCAVWGVGGRRALLVFPAPGRSHSLLGDSVARTLVDAGYQVTYVTPHPLLDTEQLQYINISSVIFDGPGHLNIMELSRSPRPAHRLLNIGPAVTSRALLHPALQTLLKDPTLTFDVVIGEWFVSELLAPLASLYNCPLIWYTAMEAHWMSVRLMHEPLSAAYSADLQSRAAPPLPYTIWERAHQLWMQLYLTAWKYYVTKYIEMAAYEEIYKSPMQLRGRTLPQYESLIYNGSLLLVNSYPPLGRPLPLPQSVKLVGGHHIHLPLQPLPTDLQSLLDNAKHGIIYFSMGSNLRSTDFPEYMKKELVDMFGQLEQTVVWKFEEPLDSLPSNVHVMNWAPQQSILNHRNMAVFISHGGQLSIIEATHFGVPMIGVPLFGDQFVNVDLMQQRGAGLRVDLTDDLPLNIKTAVGNILSNSSYRMNARAASWMFRSRLVPPEAELAYWVGLVVRTRGAPHLRSPALQLPAPERLHLDILFVIAMLLWFLSKVVKVARVHFITYNYHEDKKHK